MKVGWIGLGRVGLPMALALAYHRDCQVYGYDVSDWAARVLVGDAPPPREGIEEVLERHAAALESPGGPRIALLDSVASVTQETNIVFVCVQTPHEPGQDGTKLGSGEEHRDFEYGYLVTACREFAAAVGRSDQEYTLVVVSTTLPGTMNRLIRPLLPANVRLVYSPSFISLGSVVRDFLTPEVVLVGIDDLDPPPDFGLLYSIVWPSIGDIHMSLTSAEMTKMGSNVAQTIAITYANELAHLCGQTGADVSHVVYGINQVNRSRGMVALPGMPEGGPCRPRDLMAMAYLADRVGNGVQGNDWFSLSFFAHLLDTRETHARRIASILAHWAKLTKLPIFIVGQSYKGDYPLQDGSPAHLVMAALDRNETTYITFSMNSEDILATSTTARRLDEPGVYLVGARHSIFLRADWIWPPGSVVVDPWGVIPPAPGVIRIRPGWVSG